MHTIATIQHSQQVIIEKNEYYQDINVYEGYSKDMWFVKKKSYLQAVAITMYVYTHTHVINT
jgi:hypothetical protein